jgi:hypothetical protein
MTHEMAVLDVKGDVKIIWDPEKPVEVEAARKQFDELKKKNYAAFRVNKKGDKADVLKEFDKYAEKMIMAPLLVGG